MHTNIVALRTAGAEKMQQRSTMKSWLRKTPLMT
jgi:hypothetical protein